MLNSYHHILGAVMRFIIPLGLIILLTSCDLTTNYYTQTVESWHGGTVKSLTSRWGAPDNTVEGPGGRTMYVYKTESYQNNSTPTTPSVGISFSADGRAVMVPQKNTNTTWNRNMSVSCSAVFVANDKGKIVDTKIQGESCFGSSSWANRLSNPDSAPIDTTKKPS
jgi:hypothetical protein